MKARNTITIGPVSRNMGSDSGYVMAQKLQENGQNMTATDIPSGLNKMLSQILGAKMQKNMKQDYAVRDAKASADKNSALAAALGRPAEFDAQKQIQWDEQKPDMGRATEILSSNPDLQDEAFQFGLNKLGRDQANAEFERDANLKRELAALRAGSNSGSMMQVDPETGTIEFVPSNAPRKLSATEQKNFYEAQSTTDALENAIGTLDQVDAIPKDKMYTGFGSGAMAFANRVPVVGELIDDTKAANTTSYDTLLKELAYSRLSATFPGAISNAERESLERLQALSNYSPAEQKQIIDNARKVIERQMTIAEAKKQGIVSGDIYNGQPSSPSAAPPVPAAGKADKVRQYLSGKGMTPEQIDAYIQSKGLQ